MFRRGRPVKTVSLEKLEQSFARLVEDERQRKARLSELQQRFDQLRDGLFVHAVDTAIAMGEIILESRKFLRHGEYLPWVQGNLGVSRRTARNYEQLADWARTEPDLVDTWKALGPRKLYGVSRFPARTRRLMLKPNRRDELESMNDERFAIFLGRYQKPTRKVPLASRVNGYASRVDAWLVKTDAFAEILTEQEGALPDELAEKIQALRDRLDDLLGRGRR